MEIQLPNIQHGLTNHSVSPIDIDVENKKAENPTSSVVWTNLEAEKTLLAWLEGTFLYSLLTWLSQNTLDWDWMRY